jgi:hypothetical protein
MKTITELIVPRSFISLSVHGALVGVSLFLVAMKSVHADPVVEWNEIMQQTAATSPDPAERARTAAITQLAVFDAVNSIIGDWEPYVESVDAPEGASAEAAAIAAAHQVLVTLYPESQAPLDAARARSLAAIHDEAGKQAGVAVGNASADALLTLRATDGFDTDVPYTPGSRPGDYRPTPPELIPAFRPGLGHVAPFGIESAHRFRVDPPPALQSKAYARDFEEVKRFGELNSPDRPQNLAALAHFYAATDADGIYHPAARQVSVAQGKTLSENARIFALLSMAIWDGAVACFESKYHYNFWRPITAIREAGTDGNRKTTDDANWLPLVFTPPFPTYPSGHAAFGAAARVVLEHLFGEHGHAITLTNPAVPDVTLHYSTFKAITDDIDDARIFGGVHYRFDQEAGARQGRRVGEYIVRAELRPRRHHGPKDERHSLKLTKSDPRKR